MECTNWNIFVAMTRDNYNFSSPLVFILEMTAFLTLEHKSRVQQDFSYFVERQRDKAAQNPTLLKKFALN